MPLSDYVKRIREKIGHEPLMLIGVTAIVFDESGRVLLQRASDDGKWHTVGGALEPLEAPAHAAIREVREETGLDIEPVALTGVYAWPSVTYPNGDICLYTGITFSCRIKGEELRIADDESLELRFFDPGNLPQLTEIERRVIQDAVNFKGTTYFE